MFGLDRCDRVAAKRQAHRRIRGIGEIDDHLGELVGIARSVRPEAPFAAAPLFEPSAASPYEKAD